MAAELRPMLVPWSEAGEAWHAASAAWELALTEQLGLALADLGTPAEEVQALRVAVRVVRQARQLTALRAAPRRKPWAQGYERCVVCGTTERAHAFGGYCTACRQAEYARLHPEKSHRRRALGKATAGGGGVRE